MTDVTVTVLDPSAELRLHRLTGAFLAGYRNANTRASYLQQLHRWFAWCSAHQLDTTPIAAVRRPSRDETPRQTRLTRHELADWLNTAETDGGPIYAMACLLLLNGLRVSEVCGIDIADLAEERWHHTVTVHGKGDKDATVPSPHGPVPRSNRLSTAATAGRCYATDGATA